MMTNMNMFTHRRMVRQLMVVGFTALNMKPAFVFGLVIQFVGKISVGGNSRTRVMRVRGGTLSKSYLPVHMCGHFDVIWTTTGCLGLTYTFTV